MADPTEAAARAARLAAALRANLARRKAQARAGAPEAGAAASSDRFRGKAEPDVDPS